MRRIMTYLMILVITMRTPEIGNTAYKILKGIFITEEAFVAFEATLIPPQMKTYTTKKIMASSMNTVRITLGTPFAFEVNKSSARCSFL